MPRIKAWAFFRAFWSNKPAKRKASKFYLETTSFVSPWWSSRTFGSTPDQSGLLVVDHNALDLEHLGICGFVDRRIGEISGQNHRMRTMYGLPHIKGTVKNLCPKKSTANTINSSTRHRTSVYLVVGPNLDSLHGIRMNYADPVRSFSLPPFQCSLPPSLPRSLARLYPSARSNFME